MAEFKAEVVRVTIEEHPNADALELAVIGDYRAIVVKDHFKTGDLGVYIPEQSIVPAWLIAEMGLEGRLAGKQQNRVKAIKLRQQLSQGLVYPAREKGIGHCIIVRDDEGEMRLRTVSEGEDVTELLGITKWEPQIPTSMNGKCWNATGRTIHFDIENFKRYPDVLVEGEEVVFTEKLHGTWCCFGKNGDDYIVTSKGLSDRGLAFVLDDDNERNLYCRHFLKFGGKEMVDFLIVMSGMENVYILGEIFGRGVQDLAYGTQKPTFRIFDIYYGNPQGRGVGTNGYLNFGDLETTMTALNFNSMKDVNIEMVPVLYRGPFSKEMMDEHTDGMETVSGKGENIREGIVMHPVEERDHPDIGRVILKSVSEKYLLRKGKVTEFN
jgi:RNA ligase (TIGR02306 family)